MSSASSFTSSSSSTSTSSSLASSPVPTPFELGKCTISDFGNLCSVPTQCSDNLEYVEEPLPDVSSINFVNFESKNGGQKNICNWKPTGVSILDELEENVMKNNWEAASKYARDSCAQMFNAALTQRGFIPDNELLQRCRQDPSFFQNATLSDVRGMVKQFAEDKIGSQFLQMKLDTCSKIEKEMVFAEFINSFRALIDDSFGNYLAQKFFTVGTDQQQERMVAEMIGNVGVYALMIRASRVVQTAMETVNDTIRTRIIDELKHQTLEMMSHPHGSYVVMKAVDLNKQYKDQVIHLLLNTPHAIFKFSMDAFGCRVVQKCLHLASPSEVTVAP